MVGLLEKEGFSDLAKELQDIIDGAATGSELLFGISAMLEKSLKLTLSDTTKAKVQLLKKEVESFTLPDYFIE